MTNPIDAVIFDMDGVLIDSEPLWRSVEVEIFTDLGISFTEEMCLETVGMRTRDVVSHWHTQSPWSGPTIDEVTVRINRAMTRAVTDHGMPLPGAIEAIQFAQGKGAGIAIGSSSSRTIIDAVINRFDIANAFTALCSGEDEANGKPHPDVFLTAARKLGATPAACVVIEDSPHGIRAAKAAGMRCVAVPAEHHRDAPEVELADECIFSLHDFTEDAWQRLLKGDY